ncbi:MAG: HlyC/CorC family transporter [Provencibacterium sp.]|nr:HlyC/CorC family transporter [Provencibacterium sp.]
MDSTGWLCVSLALLLALSAFFSASETAFSTVNRIRLRTLADGGDRRAKRALLITEDYDKLISTILIGNNIVNISASSLATMLALRFLSAQMAPTVSTVAMTVLVLIFGEVTPKSSAKADAESFALRFSAPLYGVMVVLTPLSKLLVHLTRWVARQRGGEETPSVTEEELKYIIDSTVEEGVLHEDESELLHSAIEFDDIRVQEILTPRVDLAAIDVEEEPQAVLEFVVQERFSRIPVYEETVDHIIGILHTRDYLEQLATGKTPELRSLLSECLYIHKTMKISALLSEFKRKKINLAVVTDDYGGTMGIVTTEDILEELVGEIWDEDEEIVREFVPLGENRYEVAGEYTVREMLDELDMDPEEIETDSTTVGGWAMDELDRVPVTGDRFTYKNLEVTVREVDDQRIVKLLIEAKPEPEEQEE